MPIPKREATAILSSLAAGVVPRTGLRHIAVGRLREIQALKQDLDRIRDGGASVRFVVGRYGSGKSFLLQLARLHALESKFVVADADLSPERRLQGTGGQAIATYLELMRNLSTQLRPDGNALPAIVERWISNVQGAVSTKRALTPDSPGFGEAVQSEISQILNNMQELVHGFDFAQVINGYYRGYLSGDETLKSNAMRWLRGEFTTKTEARAALGVRNIIDDENWYDYLKVIARFVHDVGYAGLVISIDEAVNLYKITNSISRNSNYERILTIVNDCLQGRAGYFGFLFGGTPEFLEDQRRGLFSYEALRSRLAESRFSSAELQSFSEPVLRLAPLSHDEFFVMLQKAREIHREHVPGSRPMDDQGLITFMEEALNRIGSAQFGTPREILRDFVQLLNLLAENPNKNWQEILSGISPTSPPPDDEASSDDSDSTSENDVDQRANASTPERSQPASTANTDPLDRFTNFRIN